MTGRDGDSGRDSLDDRLVAALDRLTQAVRVMRWNVAYPHGLSPVQLSLLSLLLEAPEDRRTIGMLAAELDLSAPTVSDAVAALRRKGFVTSTPMASRRRRLDLTESGRALAQNTAGWAAPLAEVLTGVATADKATVLATVLEMIAGLQRAGVITVSRMCTTCRFFDRSGAVPRCDLLGQPLPPEALRLDCPEHQPAV